MTAKSLTHKFVSGIADGADATLVRPTSNWNDDHNFYMATRAVTTTSDTITDADNWGFVTYSNVSAISVTLPAPAGNNMKAGWICTYKNINTGVVTFNTGSTISLNNGDAVTFYSNGSIYNSVSDTAPVAAALISAFGIDNLSLAASVATNVLTVTLQGGDGNALSASNTGRIVFRNATVSSGVPINRSLTANVTIATIVGASFGTLANKAFRLWVYAYENSGSVVLGLVNAANQAPGGESVYYVNETEVQGSVAMSSSANVAQTMYTPSGQTMTNRPVRVLGYVEYSSTGLATPGTYSRVPDRIVGFGPGVKRPRDVIQEYTQSQGLAATISSASYVYSGASALIIPTSAANMMEVEMCGTAYQAVNNTEVDSQISRGTTNNTNMIGNEVYISQATSLGYGTVILQAADFPNTIASLNYGLQHKRSSGSGAQQFGPWHLRVREIQA